MKTTGRPLGGIARRLPSPLAALRACLGLLAAGIAGTSAADAPAGTARCDRPPRKVLLATVVGGVGFPELSLDKRLQRMDEFADAAALEARSSYPGKRLDLMIFPEAFIGRPGDSMEQKSVRWEEVEPRIARCARRLGCYLVAPLDMREPHPPLRYSIAAALVDRAGRLVGIYRKVHPVADQGSDVLEGGTTPGRDFPVFDCDFGRVGIQICYDMTYPDGWQALATRGAEIVALPSASAETAHPLFYALQHGYFIVSATPRDHAAVYSPLGIIEAQITTESVLVHQIDLSYALLHWEAVLENGEMLRRKFGDRIGFHYYNPEDNGIFWSNDPNMTIGQMIRSVNLVESDANAERVRVLEDRARGGPPSAP